MKRSSQAASISAISLIARRGLSPLASEQHERRAPIGGIGPALKVAAALERLHELAHRLVGHPGASGEHGQTSALPVDVLEYGMVGGGLVAVAGSMEALHQLLHHQAGGLPKQSDERDDTGTLHLDISVLDNQGDRMP